MTYIWSWGNLGCLPKSSQIAHVPNVRPWPLWTVQTHAQFNGKFAFLKFCDECLLNVTFSSTIFSHTISYFKIHSYRSIAFNTGLSSRSLIYPLVITDLIEAKSCRIPNFPLIKISLKSMFDMIKIKKPVLSPKIVTNPQ